MGHGWGEEMGRKFAATPARLIEALDGTRVLRACAGRRHSLAMVSEHSTFWYGKSLVVLPFEPTFTVTKNRSRLLRHRR